SPSAGLWPLLAAKVVTASLVGAVALARPGRDADPRRGRRFAVAGGVADAGATILLVLAVQRGPLSLVGVLVSLYPASTVVLARVLLSERISRPQALGLGLAAAAVAMIAAG
ncbi:MAG TPA: EamA family transporter, partial [Actinomycetota bacterium]|nr:EamA family transporter [Actinomycetota bacterium]